MSYEKYFKDVSRYDVVDVYRVHRLFSVNDEVLCHASKKLLLSGVRTGGKTLEQDVREARDTLNRWLEMRKEDLTGLPTMGPLREYTLEEVTRGVTLSDWARWVAVDKDGYVSEYSREVYTDKCIWRRDREKSKPEEFMFRRINKVVPPLNFKNCIWEVKK